MCGKECALEFNYGMKSKCYQTEDYAKKHGIV